MSFLFHLGTHQRFELEDFWILFLALLLKYFTKHIYYFSYIRHCSTLVNFISPLSEALILIMVQGGGTIVHFIDEELLCRKVK